MSKNKTKITAKKIQKETSTYLKSMNYSKIRSMQILDSEGKIRFLHDVKDSKCYVLLDGRTHQTYYTKSYQKAMRFYNKLVASC
ncbi:MAG: hypothetical protein GKR88_04290 [Flavobacteriaceae bacterium]|nr:MAG: hypothetical protein GKR88_04290 [Flavobacteriaceae bacterium]